MAKWTKVECRRAILLRVALGVVLLLLAGCSRRSEQLNIDLRVILPKEWKAVASWQAINIDADPEQEYLLFYRYDASTTADGERIDGPMGAVIYDPQTPASVPENAPESARPPSPWLQPYALLPSYWRGAGHGYIAPPRQTDAPQWFAVKRTRPEEVKNAYFTGLAEQPGATTGTATQESATPPPPGELPPTDELIVYGGASDISGPTHISVFWWSNPREGYGSTQITAPGGLQVEEWEGAAHKSPIRTVRARYPQHDRSLLCKESRFHRRLDPDFTSRDAYRPAVYYVEGPRKLTFCYGIPETPFYPEAVVLAYLLDPGRHKDLLADDLQERAPDILGDYAWIDALQYMATVDSFASRAGTTPGAPQITTTVWATLIYGGQDEQETRLYTFTLQHVPTDISRRTTDQWRIADVQRQS